MSSTETPLALARASADRLTKASGAPNAAEAAERDSLTGGEHKRSLLPGLLLLGLGPSRALRSVQRRAMIARTAGTTNMPISSMPPMWAKITIRPASRFPAPNRPRPPQRRVEPTRSSGLGALVITRLMEGVGQIAVESRQPVPVADRGQDSRASVPARSAAARSPARR